MRGLYLAIITLMMAGAIQVLITAFGFPDGGPGVLGKSSGARMMMERPFAAQGDEAYFRYAPDPARAVLRARLFCTCAGDRAALGR